VTAPSLDLRLLLESPLFEATALALGLVLGSFANVCIHRLPLGRSVVSPPSRCPSCDALIAPYDNVPVLAWLWLRGRCRTCRAPIPVRYPAVELLNGLLYLGLAVVFGPVPTTLVKMALVTALVVLALIDLEHQVLPDAITLSGTAAGLALGALTSGGPDRYLAALGGLAMMAAVGMVLGWDRFRGDAAPVAPDWKMVAMLVAFLLWQIALPGAPREPALAAALGYLLMATIAHVAARYYGREALGQGDWKMVAMLGAFFGLQGVLLAVFLGTLAGAASGLVLVAMKRGSRRMEVPLGTFLALGAITVIFAGDPLLGWYRSLYRG
jgi:leader peptidase (prepilin peptidase) / N-methyltransferase